jgi:bacteriorhodopsin
MKNELIAYVVSISAYLACGILIVISEKYIDWYYSFPFIITILPLYTGMKVFDKIMLKLEGGN